MKYNVAVAVIAVVVVVLILILTLILYSLTLAFILQVTTKHEDSEIPHYPSTLSVQVNGSVSITGTVIGTGVPVLLKFNCQSFNGTVPLSGNLVILQGNINPTKAFAQLISKLDAGNVNVNALYTACSSAECVLALDTGSAISLDLSEVVSGATVYPQITL